LTFLRELFIIIISAGNGSVNIDVYISHKLCYNVNNQNCGGFFMGVVNINAKAVIRDKSGEWFAGVLKKNRFIPIKKIEKLEDVEDVKKYVTLKQYLRIQSRDINKAQAILDYLGIEKAFILPKSDTSNLLFLPQKKNGSLCNSCAKECSGIGDTVIYTCSEFVQRSIQ